MFYFEIFILKFSYFDLRDFIRRNDKKVKEFFIFCLNCKFITTLNLISYYRSLHKYWYKIRLKIINFKLSFMAISLFFSQLLFFRQIFLMRFGRKLCKYFSNIKFKDMISTKCNIY